MGDASTRPIASVVIPSHNGRAWLERCLPRIGTGSSTSYEIVVSDNGSHDATGDWLSVHWPTVVLESADHGLGFAAACNRGAARARGQVLVFLNNDTEPEPGWLDRLVAPVVADPQHVVTTARLVLLDDPTMVDSAGDAYAIWGAAYKRGAGDRADRYATSIEVFSPCGAACAIAASLFERVGAFDEAFGSVYEDVDLGFRVRLAGGRCLYVPEAIVRHAGSATLGVEAHEPIRLGQRNVEWTWWANTPTAALPLALPLHAVYNVLAAAWFLYRGRWSAFARGKVEAAAGWRYARDKRRRAQALGTASTIAVLQAMTLPPVVSKWREKRAASARSVT